MKYLTIISALSVSAILIVTSCKKQIEEGPTRKVQFQLYTTNDFSDENDSIFFKISIINAQNQILFDSLLAPVKIKDIPGFAHKLIMDKVVPGNDPSLLKVGFFYTIKNTGSASHIEQFEAGKTFKVVDFNFQ